MKTKTITKTVTFLELTFLSLYVFHANFLCCQDFFVERIHGNQKVDYQ